MFASHVRSSDENLADCGDSPTQAVKRASTCVKNNLREDVGRTYCSTTAGVYFEVLPKFVFECSFVLGSHH